VPVVVPEPFDASFVAEVVPSGLQRGHRTRRISGRGLPMGNTYQFGRNSPKRLHSVPPHPRLFTKC
jgi:hypothetical protein